MSAVWGTGSEHRIVVPGRGGICDADRESFSANALAEELPM